MVNKIIKFIVLPLMIGIGIYFCFRGSDLVVYSWFPVLTRVRQLLGLEANNWLLGSSFGEYIIFSLPDGLWLYSFTCFLMLIWQRTQGKIKYLWMSSGIIIACLHEFGQGFGIFSGTFDVLDMTTYFLALLCAIFVTKKYFKEVI